METIRTTLHNAHQAHAALMTIWSAIKPWLMAGNRLHVEIKADTRNLEQNKLLHALLADISRQVEWAGQKWDVEAWKRLMTSAWIRTRGEHAPIIPALDGGGRFDVLYRHTSTLTKAECAELIEHITAWGIEHGVEFTQTETA